MAQTEAPKAIRVRAWIYCSQESFDLLAQVGQRWFDCMAAHQSNIVNDAEQAADDSQRRPPVNYAKHRANWHVASSIDAGRLRRLIELWPALTRNTQRELVEHIQTVVNR